MAIFTARLQFFRQNKIHQMFNLKSKGNFMYFNPSMVFDLQIFSDPIKMVYFHDYGPGN